LGGTTGGIGIRGRQPIRIFSPSHGALVVHFTMHLGDDPR
jgi:hypothetical protein